MKTTILILLTMGLCAHAAVGATEAPAVQPAPPSAPRVGIYDSRVVAFAYFWSAPQQKKMLEGIKRATPMPLDEARRLDAAGKM